MKSVLHAPHRTIDGASLCLRYNAKRIATVDDQVAGRRVTCKACLALLPQSAVGELKEVGFTLYNKIKAKRHG